MADFSEYERAVLAEIEAWKSAPPGVVSQAIAKVADTAPVRWIVAHTPAVPETLTRPVAKAVQGFLEMLKDGSYWTYSDDAILGRAKERGLEVQALPELADQPLEQLDQLARSFFAENKIIAALEGAGTGFGGLALIAADIPAIFTVAFRTIQQIGASYGFDMRDPNMSPIVLGIVGVASGAEEAAKIAALTDMHVTTRMFAKNWSYKKIAERTMAGGPAGALKEMAKHLPRDIANSVTKKKLAQAIPLAGAAVGAGFNYWFIASTARTAYMTFRELYLVRKRGTGRGDSGTLPSPSGNAHVTDDVKHSWHEARKTIESWSGEITPNQPFIAFPIGSVLANDDGTVSIDKQFGSCFFISSLGVFLTAWHVVSDALKEGSPLTVFFLQDTGLIEVPVTRIERVIGPEGHETDIAMGLIANLPEIQGIKWLPLSARFAEPNSYVAAYGFPENQWHDYEEGGEPATAVNFVPVWCRGTITEYIPSGRGISKFPHYVHDAETRGGISGGPLVDPRNGGVCGVNSTGLDDVGHSTAADIRSALDWPIPFAQGRTLRVLASQGLVGLRD